MLKSLAILAVLVALLPGWPCVAEDQQSKPHTKQNKPTQPKQPAPPTHVVIDPPIPAPSSQPPSKTNPETPAEKTLPTWRRSEWVIVYVTAIYCFIAWLNLRPIRRQAEATETQAREARESSAASALTTRATLEAIKHQTIHLRRQAAWQKMSAKAAMLNAKAGLESAKAANAQIEMMKEKERARVSVEIQPLEGLNFGLFNSVDIRIRIENFGPTHALNVRASGGAVATVDDDIPRSNEFGDLVAPSVIRSSFAPVERSLFVSFDEDLFQVTIPKRVKIRIDAAGIIEYDDVFGDSHRTNFGYFKNIFQIRQTADANVFDITQSSGWFAADNPEDNRAT